MKRFTFTLIIQFIVFACSADTSSCCIKSDTIQVTIATANKDTLIHIATTDTVSRQIQKEITLTPEQKKKKLLASFLAFPFPLGFLGTHRIMLGTKPWVPVAYVATFGGCFGLLPLVDFCVILLSDDIEQYENNPNVFMWIK